MPLNSPSADLSNKTNVNPSVNRSQEATAEDFNEIGDLLLEYKTAIENLQLEESPNPFYGRYTSLALLQSSYPTGELNAWSLIDAGAGITPQIAAWDDVGSEWEIVGAVDKVVLVSTFASLPAPGSSNTLYITKDNYQAYVYADNAYRLLGAQSAVKFNELTVNKIELSYATPQPPPGTLYIEYLSNDITSIYFNANYSRFLAGIKTAQSSYGLVLKIFNKTQQKTLIAKITALDYTDGTNTYYKMDLESTMLVADIALNNITECFVELQKTNINGGTP